MYGTRMAADGWQEEYSTFLIRCGFKQGTACPNVFYHEERGIATPVHGDDFTSSGAKSSLDWLESTMKATYELTVGPRLGPGKNDAKEARALNRIVRWGDQCIEYEADPRQAEKLVAECSMGGSNPMLTPGVKVSFSELEKDQPLPLRLHTPFMGSSGSSKLSSGG